MTILYGIALIATGMMIGVSLYRVGSCEIASGKMILKLPINGKKTPCYVVTKKQFNNMIDVCEKSLSLFIVGIDDDDEEEIANQELIRSLVAYNDAKQPTA